MGAYYSVEEKSVENSVENKPDMESPEIENVSDEYDIDVDMDMDMDTNIDSHFLNWWI